jgi:hypothetical protein
MASHDFVPKNDAEFQAWLANFLTVLNANLATFVLLAPDLAPLTTAQTNFATAYTAQVTADGAYRNAVENKKLKRTAVESATRAMIRRINGHPNMTDALRAQLGITVPDRVATRAGVGTEVPVMDLELRPGQVIIHFGTMPGNELRNGKPAWALGCNIYRKLGNETAYSLIAFDTASPYIDSVTGNAVNATYKVQYRGKRATDLGATSPEQTVAVGAV